MSFPIVEYSSNPHSQKWNEEAAVYEYQWGGKVMIDLRHVIAVQPGENCTFVLLSTGGEWWGVNATYSDFGRDWVRAKGL